MSDGAVVDTRPTKIMYVAEATAHGGRNGYVTSQDGQLELKVAMPPALGGDGNGTNPEQLFAAGFSACFHNALVMVGRRAASTSPAPRSRPRSGSAPTSSAATDWRSP